MLSTRQKVVAVALCTCAALASFGGDIIMTQAASTADTQQAATQNFEAAFQGECGQRNGSNPCEHICLDLHDGTYECSCFYGFALTLDGYSCVQRAASADLGSGTKSAATQGTGAGGSSVAVQVTDLTRLEERASSSSERPALANIAAAAKRLSAADDNRKLADEHARGGVSQDKQEVAAAAAAAAKAPTTMDAAAAPAHSHVHKEARKRPSETTRYELQPNIGRPRKPYKLSFGDRATPLGDISDKDDDAAAASDLVEGDEAGEDEDVGAEAGEQPDADIKSIMLANDRLAAQIERALTTRADQFEPDNELTGNAREMNSAGNDLNALLELVRKTMRADNAQSLEADASASANANASNQRNNNNASLTRAHCKRHADRPPDELRSSDNDIMARGDDDEDDEDEDEDDEDKVELDNELIGANIVGSSDEDCGDDYDKDYERRSRRRRSRRRQRRPLETDWRRHRRVSATSCAQLQCESGGRCVHEQHRAARCTCPLGRGGRTCQRPVQRDTPKFSGHSYLALPMIKDRQLATLRLTMRPQLANSAGQRRRRRDRARVLVYARDFVLLLDELGRVELRYKTTSSRQQTTRRRNEGELTRVFGSRDVEPGHWNEVLVTDANSSSMSYDAARVGYEQNDARAPNRIVLVMPNTIRLRADNAPRQRGRAQHNAHFAGELFLAGLPSAARRYSSAFDVDDDVEAVSHTSNSIVERDSLSWWRVAQGARNFAGCVSSLQLNARTYNFRSDLRGDALDGFDIGECCDA